MSKIAYNTAAGAGSIVVALAMAASVGAAGLDDALLTVGSSDIKTKGKITVVNSANFEYPVNIDSNEIMFKGIKTTGTKFPVIDFGTGNTKITSESSRDLTVKADGVLNLNPAKGVEIGGARKIGFNGNGGKFELFTAGGLNTAEIIGHNDGNITITSHKGVLVTARDGLQIGASRQLGTVGNGVITNDLELGTAKDENVAIVRTFIASVDLSPGDVVVLDETTVGRDDRSFRVTTTTTAADDATIGVVVNDSAVNVNSPVKVAIAGVARVRVSPVAAISMGAELATSTTAGAAAANTTAVSDTVMYLGIALENGSQTGKVAVLIDRR